MPLKFINHFFILLIKFYQKFISPALGNNCRFNPSCSEYSKQCFENFFFVKAIGKSVWRILRCNPYGKGGEDPVIKEKKNPAE